MFTRLNREQRHRRLMAQSTPEWKARREAELDAGITAGTHVLCVVCGRKGPRDKPQYDYCISCSVTPYRRRDRDRVIAETDARS